MERTTGRNKWIFRGKILGGFLVFWLLIMIFFPILFHNWISEKVTDVTSDFLSSELHFTDTEATFFRHFPSLTLTMEDAEVMGSGPYYKEPLIKSEALVFTISIWRLLLTNKVKIEEIDLDNSRVSFKTDRFGRSNYLIFKNAQTDTTKADSESEVYLDRIRISDADLSYQDELRGISINTRGFEYNGAGTFRNSKLELGSRFEIDSVDVAFQEVNYLKGKRLKANIALVYNDDAVSLQFQKDNFSINDLQFSFTGKLDFDPDGYNYQVDLHTEGSHVKDIISVLPQAYVSWRDKTEMDGIIDADIHLSGQNNTRADTLQDSRIAVDVELRDGTFKYLEAPVPVERVFIDLNASMQNGVFEVQADTLSFFVEKEFSRGNLFAKGRKDSLGLKTRLHSELNLHKLQESLQLPDLTFGGHFKADITAEGVYQPSASRFPITDAEFTVEKGFLKTTFPDPVEDITIDFVMENTDGGLAGTSILLKELSFNFEDNPFEVKALLRNFEMLDYDIQAKGSLDLNSFSQVAPLPYISTANGFVRLDARFKGHMEKPENGGEPEFKVEANSGTLFLENVALNVEELPRPLEIVSGDFTFRLNRLDFSDFNLKYGGNYSLLEGYFTDYLPYLLSPDGVLQGDFALKSQYIDIDALIPTKEILPDLPAENLSRTHVDSLDTRDEITGVLGVPSKINFKLNMEVDTLRHFKLYVTNFEGQVTIAEGGLVFNDTRMQMVGGNAAMKGYYRPQGDKSALFSYNLKGKDLDVKRAYEEIDLFNELVPAAQNADGIISLDYEIKGSLDGTMTPIVPSLEGGGSLMVHDVQFKNYKFFGTVSKETRLNALKDPKMEEITIHSTIDDNLLELKRFKFKVHPFRLRMEGQTTLDGKMDLQMRLGLPPFGLIGIPIKISGPSDSLKIKVGKREKDLEALNYNDTEFSEQERLKFRMLRDSINADMSIDEINALEVRMDSLYFPGTQKGVDSLLNQPNVDTSGVDLKR